MLKAHLMYFKLLSAVSARLMRWHQVVNVKPLTLSDTYLNLLVTTVVKSVEASFSHHDAIFKCRMTTFQPASYVSRASVMRNATVRTGL